MSGRIMKMKMRIMKKIIKNKIKIDRFKSLVVYDNGRVELWHNGRAVDMNKYEFDIKKKD